MFKIQRMSPAEYEAEGFKHKISYGFYKSPFGKCLIGILNNKEKAICHLSFVDGSESEGLKSLKNRWKKNDLILESKEMQNYVNEVFSNFSKGFFADSKNVTYVILKGTDFQIKVWEQLINIPSGSTATYEKVAEAIDKPKAVRAVANAISNNQIGCLIPCHRVFGKNGSNKYEWGVERKDKILKFEKDL
ncbi:bifunctional transcriptional activator/DNA repair enzyme Ada [Belonocnema kinseyi]|uniref:bifunctional transcriptional activator/DNA repair enzyme Ada n=1 Tax=Belonocnema kinseyi TaxID=2817044 RepID=UPI00143CC291|nr:bifunctional transcriptional activator/DNA repair enzyme Ada [Belonocnema kinseyi]